MQPNLENLYGVFEMHGIQTTLNGKATSEKVNSGIFVFTPDNRVAVVSGTNESVMAYSGSFELKEGTLYIHAESCNIREREGTILIRRILKLDATWLVVEVVNLKIGMRAEVTWRKKFSVQLHSELQGS